MKFAFRKQVPTELSDLCACQRGFTSFILSKQYCVLHYIFKEILFFLQLFYMSAHLNELSALNDSLKVLITEKQWFPKRVGSEA